MTEEVDYKALYEETLKEANAAPARLQINMTVAEKNELDLYWQNETKFKSRMEFMRETLLDIVRNADTIDMRDDIEQQNNGWKT